MANIEMYPVSSSNLRAVGYDAKSQTLHIQFHSGGLYEYCGVDQQTYDELLAASSQGTYFHQHIKDVFGYRKLG